MEDAVRPNKQAFKAMYERGYRTWFSLYEMVIADSKADLPWWHCVFQLERVFSNHPSFPTDLAVDKSFPNTVVATGVSTWRTTQGPCDLPSSDQEFQIQVASDHPTILVMADPQPSSFAISQFCNEEDDHTTVLILAWTYILSARWAEIIPGASGPEYTNHEAEWVGDDLATGKDSNSSTTTRIDLGDIDDDAARWWIAVLAMEVGWNASIQNNQGSPLHSPWYTKLNSEVSFTLSRGVEFRHSPGPYRAASFATALRFLSDYCKFHEVVGQSYAALAAALLLPVTKWDNSTVRLSIPRVHRKTQLYKMTLCNIPLWSENLGHLDRLLALSCNSLGTKALITSVFFEPGVECNICGAWIQGSLAFLNSDLVHDQQVLLRVLMKRDPDLGLFWLGAFILGAHKRALQEARSGWWKIDLHAAAWTGTLMSFIQQPVTSLKDTAEDISRANECRLMYLSHDQLYTNPPLFPFAPFGSTAMTDTNIDVRQHIHCQTRHGLEYEGFAWRCRGGQQVVSIPRMSLRAKNGKPTDHDIAVDYRTLNNEVDQTSEMVTSNIFTWLRGCDGFPVAERPIREHEWLDNLDSDDDSPAPGDAQSTAGGNLHGWLSKTMTKRSNSL